jgi:hypothetical protein
MFMCVVNLKSVNKLDLTWKQSFLIHLSITGHSTKQCSALCLVLCVIMLNVVMLNVVMLNVVMLNVVMLNVVMLNIVMLSVVAPNIGNLIREFWELNARNLGTWYGNLANFNAEISVT